MLTSANGRASVCVGQVTVTIVASCRGCGARPGIVLSHSTSGGRCDSFRAHRQLSSPSETLRSITMRLLAREALHACHHSDVRRTETAFSPAGSSTFDGRTLGLSRRGFSGEAMGLSPFLEGDAGWLQLWRLAAARTSVA
ncbi:hypothetical protein HPB50_017683 [Hyalomma asiaticum]|uniref:Uncharacterized protein n=1 Tax=Hyalomma asiaticum TaxID=266040 RepID=A0ACB7SI26_HYAAI|nr:hypothetical protein HPB50_017683 [Hyalomma asiaticum]